MTELSDLLDRCAGLHHHLCPRQVLGVRMGMAAGRLLGLELPRDDKRLFVFMETDGCGADGVSVATGCWVGRRTMRIIDQGKVAATFVDNQTGHAVRIRPHPLARQTVLALLPRSRNRWHAQLDGYQVLSDEQLLEAGPVDLLVDVETLIGRPGTRARCRICGEEILNQREVMVEGATLCRGCAGDAYCMPSGFPHLAADSILPMEVGSSGVWTKPWPT